jgi:hypothetical protein
VQTRAPFSLGTFFWVGKRKYLASALKARAKKFRQVKKSNPPQLQSSGRKKLFALKVRAKQNQKN